MRFLQDGIGFGGPLEGLWLGVALGYPGLDCGFEIGDALEHSTPDALARDLGEQSLYEIEPGRRRRNEVQLEARMLRQPRQ